jgi:hypothetical protein
MSFLAVDLNARQLLLDYFREMLLESVMPR